MSELLERALTLVRAMPPEVQDELARILLQLAGEEPPAWDATPDEETSFQTSFEQAQRGEFAMEEDVRAIWAKHDL